MAYRDNSVWRREPWRVWLGLVSAACVFLLGMVIGRVIGLAETQCPPPIECPDCNLPELTAYTLKAIEDASCSYELCEDTFKKWKAGREYPCPLLRMDRDECEAALDRKCPETKGRVLDLEADLRACVAQVGNLTRQVASCCRVDSIYPVQCTDPHCEKRHNP